MLKSTFLSCETASLTGEFVGSAHPVLSLHQSSSLVVVPQHPRVLLFLPRDRASANANHTQGPMWPPCFLSPEHFPLCPLPSCLLMLMLEISNYTTAAFRGSGILCSLGLKMLQQETDLICQWRKSHLSFTVPSRTMMHVLAMCLLVYKAFEANKPFLLEQRNSYSFNSSNTCSFLP